MGVLPPWSLLGPSMCGLHSRAGMPRTVPRRDAPDRRTSRTPTRDHGPNPPRAAVLRPHTATTLPSATDTPPKAPHPGHRATVTGCAGSRRTPSPAAATSRSHTTHAALTTDPHG